MARLLDTKLQPPPLRDERVYRPRLYHHLADFNSGVVLVSSPPGFGKSTLVVECLQPQNRPFAWYSLGRYDGDVSLFSDYARRAIRGLTGYDGDLSSLPGEITPDARTMIAILVEDLAEAPAGSDSADPCCSIAREGGIERETVRNIERRQPGQNRHLRCSPRSARGVLSGS